MYPKIFTVRNGAGGQGISDLALIGRLAFIDSRKNVGINPDIQISDTKYKYSKTLPLFHIGKGGL